MNRLRDILLGLLAIAALIALSVLFSGMTYHSICHKIIQPDGRIENPGCMLDQQGRGMGMPD